jgi:hypothetical protein
LAFLFGVSPLKAAFGNLDHASGLQLFFNFFMPDYEVLGREFHDGGSKFLEGWRRCMLHHISLSD